MVTSDSAPFVRSCTLVLPVRVWLSALPPFQTHVHRRRAGRNLTVAEMKMERLFMLVAGLLYGSANAIPAFRGLQAGAPRGFGFVPVDSSTDQSGQKNGLPPRGSSFLSLLFFRPTMVATVYFYLFIVVINFYKVYFCMYVICLINK